MLDLNEFRVLIVDDNPAIHKDFAKILVQEDDSEQLNQLEAELFGDRRHSSSTPLYRLESAYQGQDGVEKVAQAARENQPFSLAFVDMRMPPGISGVETIERMWDQAPDLQVVICTAHSDYSWKQIVSRIGWSDRLLILKKPFDKVEVCQMALSLCVKYELEQMARLNTEDLRAMVAQKTIELEKEIQRREQVEAMLRENPNQIYNSNEVDEATGLLNRQAILERIKFLAIDSDDHDAVYSLLVIDIDHLKDINDQHGHQIGDTVLKNVAQRLRETLRPNDIIGRLGGEEFIIGLRNCTRENAILVGERLRQRVADSTIVVEGSHLMVTVSVGVATQDPRVRAVTEKVIECADQALYLAKNNGRNRVESQVLVC
jgi:diguanylate cyclase (GGDEF)-like protein